MPAYGKRLIGNSLNDDLEIVDHETDPTLPVPQVTIQQQIDALEVSITPRRFREAMLNKGQGIQFVQDIDAQIELLRLQLG